MFATLLAALNFMGLALAAAPAEAFPKPDRPVASVVSPTWATAQERDTAKEVDQIITRLKLKPGMTVADLGAGDGYDSLRLAPRLGPKGRVIAEDITPDYLAALADEARRRSLTNITTVLGEPHDPRLAPNSVDAAILIHMYHEIEQPYGLLWNLVPALKPGARVGVEDLDRPTPRHGTPPKLLVCEFAAVGYRLVELKPLSGNIGYFAVFEPPAKRPEPRAIKPCKG